MAQFVLSLLRLKECAWVNRTHCVCDDPIDQRTGRARWIEQHRILRGQLAQLAGGSVGEAFRLSHLEGLKLYATLIRLLSTLPKLDRTLARAVADNGANRKTPEAFDLTVTLLDALLARTARAAATRTLPPEAAKGEAALIERLAQIPDAALVWADLAQHLGLRARKGKAVNLDPAALLMDMLLKVDETAAQVVNR